MIRCADCLSPAAPCSVERHVETGEWFELGPDDRGFPLRDAPAEMLRRLVVGGPVRVALPFETGCLEQRAWFHVRTGVEGEPTALTAAGGDFGLGAGALAQVFADVRGGCVRCFDAEGHPTLVIRPEGARAAETMAAIVARFARTFKPVPPARPAPLRAEANRWIEAALRVDALRVDWLAMRHADALTALLAHYDLGCGAALRLLGERWARPVETEVFSAALAAGLAGEETLEVAACGHLATGRFHLAGTVTHDGRRRLLGGGAALCLVEEALETWVAVRPGLSLPVSLVLLDGRGELVAIVSGDGPHFSDALARGLLRADAA